MNLFLTLPGIQICISPIDTAECHLDGRYVILFRKGRDRQICLAADTSPSLPPPTAETLAIIIDPTAAKESLERISQSLGGLAIDMSAISRQLAPLGGFGSVDSPAWTELVFSALEEIPAENRGCYCLLKAVELLHLTSIGAIPLCRLVSDDYFPVRQQAVIREVCQYIKENVGEDLSIERLSRKFYISPTALKQGFRQLYGKTVHDVVSDYRMERAAALLTGTKLTVLRICQEVGYGSTSHFSAMFRKKYFLTPAQFRKKNV